MDSNDIDHLLKRHTIRISKLSRFRLLYGSEWIADQWEGVTSAQVSVDLTGEEDQPNIRGRLMREAGIITTSRSKVKIDTKVVKWGADHFVFCLSRPPLESATTAMCDDPDPAERYNACVAISSLDEFRDDLFSTGRVVELNVGLREAFGLYDEGSVVYRDTHVRFPEQQIIGNDPFTKRPKFCGQQEYRFVFPQKPHYPEVLTIEFNPRPGLFHRLFSASPPPPKIGPALDRLRAIDVFESAAASIRSINRVRTSEQRTALWQKYESEFARDVREFYKVVRTRNGYTPSKMLDFHFGRFFSHHNEQWLADDFDKLARDLRDLGS